MMEKLKKFGRTLRRDYFGAVETGACGAFVAMGAAMGLATGGVLAGAIAGVAFAGVLAVAFIARAEIRMRRTRDIDVGFRVAADGIGYFTHLKGPGKKIAAIANTEKRLQELLHPYRNEQLVTAEAMQRLRPYLQDAYEAGREVRAYVPDTPIELTTFRFLRKYFNAAGSLDEQAVAEIELPHAPPPWEVERRLREILDAEIAEIHTGSARDVTVRTLRLKPKSDPSRSPG